MSLESEIYRIFSNLHIGLYQWVEDTVKILDDASSQMTASVSWDLINRKLKRQINKWYLLVDEAYDDVQEIVEKHGLDGMPPILENEIRTRYEPKLKALQNDCKEILDKYKNIVASNLEKEIVEELLLIAHGITIDNIISIIKEKDLDDD